MGVAQQNTRLQEEKAKRLGPVTRRGALGQARAPPCLAAPAARTAASPGRRAFQET